MTTKYSEKDITALEGLQGIRKNTGMYLGNAETQVFHTLREIVENCVDLFEKKLNKYVSIAVTSNKKEQTFTIIDKGPGIPVGINKELKKSTLEVVLTTIHAGSNFNKKAEGKASTRGKHGVGLSAVVATAKHFVVYTNRDGIWYTQEYAKGKKLFDVKKCKLPAEFKGIKTGTIIRYVPDYTVLPHTILKHSELGVWSKTVAHINSGLTVVLNFNGKEHTFLNKKGIVAVLDNFKVKHPKNDYIGKPFVYEDGVVKIALQWSTLEGEHVKSYVNGAESKEGGTHVQGAFDVISKVFKKVLTKGAEFSASDLREGLILVIAYYCTDDDYSGQNKEKLNSPSAINIVKNILEEPLNEWINKNQKTAKLIVRRAADIAKAKKQAKALTRAAGVVKSDSRKGVLLAGKLAMCDKKTKAEEVELFLVEGDSAGGGVKEARNPKFQEVLSCRGKGLNVVKATLAKILANKEISNLLLAISGSSIKEITKTGILSKFRVGKILLFSDSDEDGNHISALWLATLLRFAPAAFTSGMVYKVESPLFIDSEDKTVYGFTLKEIQSKMKPQHYSRIVRCKGLGEFQSAQLEPFINPETRKLVQLTSLTKKEYEEVERLMGNDTQYRKVLLEIQDRK